MKFALSKSEIAVAVAVMLSGMSGAQAALVAGLCEVNGSQICGAEPTIASNGVLTIRGYAFDPETGDRPSDSVSGYVILHNESTGQYFRVPVQRTEARPDVVVDYLPENFNQSQYSMVNAGFIAQVFMASLPPGTYSVQDARVMMSKSGTVSLGPALGNAQPRFVIAEGESPFQLIQQDGTVVPLKMARVGTSFVATGYPALHDGNFTIKAVLPSYGTQIEKSVPFAYQRPTLAVPVSLPLVDDFPGLAVKMAPINPLTNKTLDTTSLSMVVESGNAEGLSINGAPVVAGGKLDVTRLATSSGVYTVNVKDAGTSQASKSVKMWINLPDAPNIVFTAERWDPASKVLVSSSKDSAAIKVEDIDIQAKLDPSTKDLCSSLTMIRPGYTLSQTAAVNCAVRFGDLPEGMKYNPYASNALRGSLASVGDNTLSYTAGVVYTDPATRQTAFYPAKTPASQLTLKGVEPALINLSFVNDKSLDAFYAQNQSQYPNNEFALVDKVQARSLGIVKVRSPYRDVTTRVSYPDGTTKETNSSLTDSNVSLAMQAYDPWERYPVKVESWYQRAPEFKSEVNLDFIGVPSTPIVDFERTFTSHDKADTVLHGIVGVSRGQNIVFDWEAMGKWQVSIKEDKTGNVLSAPVTVEQNGSFTVNLGRLSAGTRYVVAEAKMIDTSGLVSNSSVVSKSRSLITAVGDMIEAKLSARAMSGKAPFVQTISTSVNDSKLLANIQAVTWERQTGADQWEVVMRNDTDVQTGLNYTATVKDVGNATYRAVLTNKYSGAVYKTDPLTLTAFDVPTFSIKAPSVVQVNRPVTLSVEAPDNYEATYAWKLITTTGLANPEQLTGTGKTFTFTPTELKSYSLEVVGKSASAPDNPAAEVKKTTGVKAVNPLAARASLQGPTYVETGKPYQYKATINDVVSGTVDKSYVIKGYWILPDGSRVDGVDLEFTPRKDDKLLSFYTYVDGYPEETSVSTLAVRTWDYTWPVEWRIKLIPQQTDVPATVKYSVETPNFDIKSLNGEQLTYTWSLPDGITRTGTSSTDVAGTLTVNKHGTFQVAVQVADTRGNAVNISSEQFTILPPASVKAQMTLTSKYGEEVFAPGSYYVGLKLLEVPRGDSFLRNEMMVNAEKVGEFTGSGTYIAFKDPGKYGLVVRTITKAGNYGETSMDVDVKIPPAPECNIKQTPSTSGNLLTADCTVAVGFIKQTLWTYELDGVAQKSTSKSFLINKAWVSTGRLKNLKLTVETDLGAVSEQAIPIQ